MQIVAIFSDANFLALNLLENLLTKNTLVNIIAKDTKSWLAKTSHIANKNRFSIIDYKKYVNKNFSYSIIISGFLKGDPYENINEVFSDFKLNNSKNLIIVPFEKYSFEKNVDLSVPNNVGIIYCGDVIGPRMDLDTDLLMPQVITSVYYKRKIRLAIGEIFYPMLVSDLIKTLNKWLFSFGPYGEETFLIGPQISGTDFWKIHEGVIDNVKIEYDENLAIRKSPKKLETKVLTADTKSALIETYKWLSTNPPEKQPKILKPKIKSIVTRKSKTQIKYPKFLRPLTITLFILLVFPIIMLFVSAGLFYFSYRDFLGGKDRNSQNLLLLSKTFSVVSREESRVLSIVPLLGKPYRELVYISEASVRFSDIGASAIPVLRTASNLTDKLFGNSIYDSTKDSENIKTGLDQIYQEISLLQADTNSAILSNLGSAKYLNRKINLENYKNLALYGKGIADNLPDVLGKRGAKTYLLLFQNNMELRATGGFIGSFGLLTFDGGRITDLTVNDVYSADGQLNGHVEPPAPIKKYLNEANWWFRDSNWDPDFPTSAKRAEWFLDKEMGKSVDGVMAIDLEPVKNILKYTGPIFLPDYNEDITSDNLYTKTQEEVQENFFPGSRKKASFLTALSRSLISEISKLKTSQKTGILKSFYTDLTERHIQMFFHDEHVQDAVSSLSWDGAVGVPACGEACYADFVGEVESNFGVNKANYFIDRRQDLAVLISSRSIERTLTVTLKNTSNPALGPSGKYGVYMRFLIPKDSSLESLTAYTGESIESLTPEIVEVKNRKEVGTWVEVLGSQSKKVEIKWNTAIAKDTVYTKYGLYIRKQAGVGNDAISLTINDKVIYNSNLAADYFDRFSLK